MGNMKSFGLSGREGLVCFEGQGRRVGRRTEADQPERHAESTDIMGPKLLLVMGCMKFDN